MKKLFLFAVIILCGCSMGKPFLEPEAQSGVSDKTTGSTLTGAEFTAVKNTADTADALATVNETFIATIEAISGIVECDGAGTCTAATAGTDYLTPSGDGSSLTGVDAATGDSATSFFDAGEIEVVRGGTGASSASGARTNLGLVIGTDVQGVLAEGAFVAGDKTDHDTMVGSGAQGVGSGDAPTLAATNFTGVQALVDACKDQTFQTFGSADTTPDVSNGGTGVWPCWQVHQSTSPTITDFDDGDDHSELSAADKFLLLVNYTPTIDFSGNANIEGNSNVDFTGAASQEMYIGFMFDGTKWISTLHGGWSNPTTLAVSAMAITTLEASELNDTSDPHTLTSSELMSHYISNAESVGADEWDFPARAEGWDFCFVKEVDQNVTLDPNGTEQWQYRTDNSGYTQLAAGEALVNTTAGESSICCHSTETAVYCSADANWAEEAP